MKSVTTSFGNQKPKSINSSDSVVGKMTDRKTKEETQVEKELLKRIILNRVRCPRL